MFMRLQLIEFVPFVHIPHAQHNLLASTSLPLPTTTTSANSSVFSNPFRRYQSPPSSQPPQFQIDSQAQRCHPPKKKQPSPFPPSHSSPCWGSSFIGTSSTRVPPLPPPPPPTIPRHQVLRVVLRPGYGSRQRKSIRFQRCSRN
jgi:hypothetical protein